MAGPSERGSRTSTSPAPPSLVPASSRPWRCSPTTQAHALLATDTTHLAVDGATGSRLAALAGQQGWQLLTLASIARSATVVGDHQGLGRDRAHR
jgi:hypothetical protein